MHSFAILVSILVSPSSGVSPRMVHQVQEQVRRIYADVGVQVEWSDPSTPTALIVNVMRTVPPLPGCESAFGCSLIDRLGTTRPVAFVANEAIRNQELQDPLLRGRMMAYVMAHEIGHLIGLAHTNGRGIMHRNSQWLPHVKWTQTEASAIKAILNRGEFLAMRLSESPELPASRTDYSR